MTSALFRYVTRLQDGAAWGDALDAGTGVNSATWLASLETRSLTLVTAAPAHAAQVRRTLDARLRRQDRLLVGNWTDASLLRGERFETVLADYLLGAAEAFSPGFQEALFARLRPHVAGRLYVVGLDPYVTGAALTPAHRTVAGIGRFRDACLLLAGETPYREYPAKWAAGALVRCGFRVVAARRFANRYRPGWIDSQIDMALMRLPVLPDQALPAALRARAETLRAEAHALCAAEDGLRAGHDYVIACEPA